MTRPVTIHRTKSFAKLVFVLVGLCFAVPAAADARNANHTGFDNMGVFRMDSEWLGFANVYPSNNQYQFSVLTFPSGLMSDDPGHVAQGSKSGSSRDAHFWTVAGNSLWIYNDSGVRVSDYHIVGAPDSCQQTVAGKSTEFIALVGDWDGNGLDSGGLFCKGKFWLRNSNTDGSPSYQFTFGVAGDIPVVGDWDGNGTDTVAVYRGNGYWYQLSNNTPASGTWVNQFQYGWTNQYPVAGDWNNDGKSTIGIYTDDARFWLRNSNSAGAADAGIHHYGAGLSSSPADFPVIGDWDGF